MDPIRPASTLAFDGYTVLACDPGGQFVEERHGRRRGLLDRYLAGATWDAQQTDEPVAGTPPDNLDRPVEVDVAARGAFDDLASDRARCCGPDLHRRALAGIAAAAAAIGGVALLGRRRG